ncbi:hypothetical protein CNR22_20355 [Sphingobacteriaceae bacterium]|nr:hypothetical protein CNR22_20355 [Sphingobacteriaceae bacterium]
MIKKILFCVLTIVVITAKAQFPTPYVVPNIDWINYYSQRDTVSSAPSSIDANSNVYTTGYSGFTSGADLVAIKYDSTGVQQFVYTYNGGSFDVGNSIKVSSAGNVYVAGVTTATSGTTAKNYIIVKLNSSGTQQWVKTYDRGVNGDDEASDLAVDANGNVYVTGKSKNSSGNYDIVTLKLNGSTGVTTWSTAYTGSGFDDYGVALALSPNGSYLYITGNTFNSSTGWNIVTHALNTGSGTSYWSSPIVTNGSANATDRSNAIMMHGTDVIICGEKTNATTGLDYSVIKYSGASGTILWQNSYDYNNTANRATALVRDSMGNIGVVGTVLNGASYEYHTVLYSSFGFQYAVNIESTGLGILVTDPTIANDTIAHHWYVAGEKLMSTKDIYVYQITPSGNTSWRQNIDGIDTDNDAGTAIAVNGVGVVYVGAMSRNSSAQFDYTTIKLNQTPVYWPPDFNNDPVNPNHLYIKNQGQLLKTNSSRANEVLYYTANANPEIFIEKDAFDIVYRKTDINRPDTGGTATDTVEKIKCKFLHSNSFANHHDFVPSGYEYNYFLGYASKPEITDIKGNQRVFVPNFYPYIDLHYFSGPSGIKYYLVVKPGALLDNVHLQVDGSSSTSLDGTTGNLKIQGVLDDIQLKKPIAYTVDNLGQVVSIAGSASWSSLGGNTYKIIPPVYTPTLPLIIQVSSGTLPTSTPNGSIGNLAYSTYYGGPGNEWFNDIAAANNGDRHAVGYADAITFPAVNSLQPYKGNKDVVFVKYLANDTLKYASFLGGTGADVGNSIALNSSGDVFVGGQTFSTDFYTAYLTGASNQTVNGYAGNPGLGFKADGFLFKYVPSAAPTNKLPWSRYVGGSRSDCINSVCVDVNGILYFGGYADSPDMIMTNAWQSSMGTWNVVYNRDAIFGKINTNLQTSWMTYYGSAANGTNTSSAYEEALDVVVDNSGRLIGAGWTESLSTPIGNSTGNTNTFYQSTRKGSVDGLLIRFSTSGTPDFRSFFGGKGQDKITRLAYNSLHDEIYFAGESDSSSAFPFHTKTGATNSQYRVKRNAFIGMMDGSLTKLWSSFYGKGVNKTYNVTGLSVDDYGVTYLSGWTNNDTLQYPVSTPTNVVYNDNAINGSEDGYIAVYSPSKTLYHAHYFGGSSDDRIASSDIGQNSKLWVVGNTTSNDFPIAYNSSNALLIDQSYNGSNDGYISRFDLINYQVTGLSNVDFDKALLSIYPNPTSTQFIVELEGELLSSAKIQVYNLMGQILLDQTIDNNKTAINCESWTNGVYLIKITNNNSQTVYKLIKN